MVKNNLTGAEFGTETGVFAPPSLQQRVVRERIPGLSCPKVPQGVLVRCQAGCVINKLSFSRTRTLEGGLNL